MFRNPTTLVRLAVPIVPVVDFLGWSRHLVWTSNNLGDFAVRVEVNVKVKAAFAFGLTGERHHLKNNVPASLGFLDLR